MSLKIRYNLAINNLRMEKRTMNFKNIFIGLMAILFFNIHLNAQSSTDSTLVQFSGMVLDGTNDALIPIPYVNILVKGEGRGTYTNFDGFFSLVTRKGDVIVFSAVGYKKAEYTIPADLKDNHYSFVQLLTTDTINLPTAVVFPWPNRDHFKLEFLAMDVTHRLQQNAAENLANDRLAMMRNEVPSDGIENASYHLRQQAARTYYIGQTPPMNIFNPLAWKKFYDSWKRGDYKKKKKK